MYLAVVLDVVDLPRLADFWRQALDFDEVHRDDPYIALRAKDGARPTLVLQRVPEVKVTKNRMHLDLHTDAFERDLERLEALGATRKSGFVEEQGMRWLVLGDPEDNEFCLLTRAAPAG